MTKNNAVQSIKMPIPGTDKVVDIKLDGKNLIITGGNGCGKTRFLKKLYQNIEGMVVSRQSRSKKIVEDQLEQERNYFVQLRPTDQHYFLYKDSIQKLEKELSDKMDIDIELSDIGKYRLDFNDNKALLRIFDAVRANDISHFGMIDSLNNLRDMENRLSLSEDSSKHFESYLTSYFNYANYIKVHESNSKNAVEIDEWFNHLDDQLQYLFEDETLKLLYNPEEQCFYIHQNGKEPYRFNQLSSGYQSILSIYADLLVKVELKEITAEQLSGVVLIDEIDAHLHVSLQRKIFSFFTKAFPNVQFIVTTHSPFVVQSVSNVVIYDLSKNEQLSDLSMYSYDAIVKGLLGVSTMSDVFNKDLDELAHLINTKPLDKESLQQLVDKISPYEHELDMRSKAFLLLGKNTLLDAKDEVNG